MMNVCHTISNSKRETKKRATGDWEERKSRRRVFVSWLVILGWRHKRQTRSPPFFLLHQHLLFKTSLHRKTKNDKKVRYLWKANIPHIIDSRWGTHCDRKRVNMENRRSGCKTMPWCTTQQLDIGNMITGCVTVFSNSKVHIRWMEWNSAHMI